MIDITPQKRIHFLGIGGCGMSAIAKLLLKLNYKVSGTDMKESTTTIRLRDEGARIFIGHSVSNVREADVIVVSTAISEDNEEYQAALDAQLPILHRSEMLNFIMSHYSHKISVAGTHGKTTTSGLTSCLFWQQKQKPTFIVGSDVPTLGTNADLGHSNYVIAESDESDGSFLNLEPTVAILLNLEEEHMNYYKTKETLIDHFKTFMSGVIDRGGYLIVNAADENLMALASTFPEKKILTYALTGEADVVAEDIAYHSWGTSFKAIQSNGETAELKTQLFGAHNVENALAAYLCGVKELLTPTEIKNGLYAFTGTKRRMQHIGTVNDVSVYDDYGHHPTEVSTTLKGLKDCLQRPITCIFQPHRYSRTQDLLDEFASCFDAADTVIITEVFAANETPIPGISGQALVDKMHAKGLKSCEFIAKKSDIPPALLSRLNPNDIVITMGAGDVHIVAKELVTRLKKDDQQN